MRKQLSIFEFPEESRREEDGQGIDNNPEELRALPHLEVYENHFILAGANNAVARIWTQGKQTRESQIRYQKVNQALRGGFFDQKIEEAKSPDIAQIIEAKLPENQRKAIDQIIGSVTSEMGRALVDIFVLQLVIKAICPEQDVRLHKGNKSSRAFSWREGISMRSIDASYIGPSLRGYDLLRMNKDGAFMSRSFAENYPYTQFYKAEIRGAKQQGKQGWLQIIDDLENEKIDADTTLLYVLQLLWKHSEAFKSLVQKTLISLETWISRKEHHSINSIADLIKQHIEKSETRARLLEIAMHALLQALGELGIDLGGNLKPLMPMRTANLKHGNLGDVEVLSGNLPIEAWDAKYDNPYLSDVLEELVEKIQKFDVVELRFGYVLFPVKKGYSEVDRKVEEIEEQFGLKVEILSFDDWINEQLARSQETGVSEETLAKAWLYAYVESLGQKRRDKAPIDEPTFD
jgi:hypothetical protein